MTAGDLTKGLTIMIHRLSAISGHCRALKHGQARLKLPFLSFNWLHAINFKIHKMRDMNQKQNIQV